MLTKRLHGLSWLTYELKLYDLACFTVTSMQRRQAKSVFSKEKFFWYHEPFVKKPVRAGDFLGVDTRHQRRGRKDAKIPDKQKMNPNTFLSFSLRLSN